MQKGIPMVRERKRGLLKKPCNLPGLASPSSSPVAVMDGMELVLLSIDVHSMAE
jgi:hypothetical protein